MLTFARRLIRLRAEHPVFRRRRFFTARRSGARRDQLGDIAWFTPAAEQMTDEDWDAGFAEVADRVPERRRDQRAGPGAASAVRDESFLLLFNASELDLEFTLPARRYGEEWATVLDTAGLCPPVTVPW